VKLAPHKSIREQYNPRPNAKEKRFHLWLMDMPCEACGIDPCGVFHHLLTDTPEKRWDRDHEMGLALCDPCHRELHRNGNEQAWCAANGIEPVGSALGNREMGRRKGLI